MIDITTLNEEQFIAYDLVRRHVADKNAPQLLFRLEGTAGVGKSHVVNAWCQLFSEREFAVAAPTGRILNL